MHADDLRELYEYHYWANAQLLQVVAELSPEQFCREVAGSYGSVRNTLVHVVSAEWGWLDRCGGPPRGSKLDAKDFGTPESLLRTSSTVEQSMRSLLSKLDDDGARRVVEFSFPGSGSQRKTVGHLLWHAANHAAHHRGQVAMLLRIIGHTPGNFDVLFFEDSRPASAGQ